MLTVLETGSIADSDVRILQRTPATIHAFLWSNGLAHDLGTYPQDAIVTVVPCCNSVNNRGQIVGFSLDTNFNQRALPIKGLGPAARGATKPPALPAGLQKGLLRRQPF